MLQLGFFKNSFIKQPYILEYFQKYFIFFELLPQKGLAIDEIIYEI